MVDRRIPRRHRGRLTLASLAVCGMALLALPAAALQDIVEKPLRPAPELSGQPSANSAGSPDSRDSMLDAEAILEASEFVPADELPFVILPKLPSDYVCLVGVDKTSGLTSIIIASKETTEDDARPALTVVAIPSASEGQTSDESLRVSNVQGFILGVGRQLIDNSGGQLLEKSWPDPNSVPLDAPFDIFFKVRQPAGSALRPEGGIVQFDGRIRFDATHVYQFHLMTRTDEERAKFLKLLHAIRLKSETP